MPYSIVIDFMIPPRGSPDWTGQMVNGFREASCVNVRPFVAEPETIGSPYTGLLFCHDVPDDVLLEKLRGTLTEHWIEENPNAPSPGAQLRMRQEPRDPEPLELPDGTIDMRERVWIGDFQNFVQPGRGEMIVHRKVTVPYARMVQLLFNQKELRYATDEDFK